MDKKKFVKKYKKHISVHFDYGEFSKLDLDIRLEKRKLQDFIDFYTPWYSKNGEISSDINKVVQDKLFKPIQIRQIIDNHQDWFSLKDQPPKKLWPIPIITDYAINKSLILDSNKTICSLIFHNLNYLTKELDVVEVKGHSLDSLNPDLKILYRTLS